MTKLQKVLICTVTAAIAGCSASEVQNLVSEPDGKGRGRALNLECSPQQVGPGDVVRVRFLKPHGGAAAIVRPDGSWSHLAIPDWDSETYPPLSSVYLKASDVLDIPISQVSGAVYDTPFAIFRESGTYRFYVGQALETFTQDDSYEGYCDIDFDAGRSAAGKNLRRPKPDGWLWVMDEPTKD